MAANPFQTGPEYLATAPQPVAPMIPAPPAYTPQPFRPVEQNYRMTPPTAAAGGGIVAQRVKEAEAAKGGILSEDELNSLWLEKVKPGDVMPMFMRPGVQQFQLEVFGKQADLKFDEFRTGYLASNNVVAAPESTATGSHFTEIAAAPISGAIDALSGLASLTDYGIRAGKGLALGTRDLLYGKKKLSDIDAASELLAEYAPKATPLGNFATDIGKLAEGVRKRGYSPETMKARAELSQSMADKDYGKMGNVLWDNWSLVGTMAGEMLGNVGGAGQLTKIPKYAKAIEILAQGNKAGRYGSRLMQVAPSAFGYAGQAGRDFENNVRSIDIDELIKNPEFKKIYDAVQAVGDYTPEQVAEKTKDRIVTSGMDEVLVTSLAANLALPAMGKLGLAERAFAAGGKKVIAKEFGKGFWRGAASGTGREGIEEGLASGIEQVGQNIAYENPIEQGVGPNMALGATVGAVIGAPIGGYMGSTAKPVNPLKKPVAGKPTANAPTGKTDDTVADTSIDTAPVFSPVDNPNFGAVFTNVVSSIVSNAKFMGAVAKQKIETPEALLKVAERQAMKQAAKSWGSLSVAQQVQLTGKVAAEINRARGKNRIEGVEALVATALATVPGVQPVVPPVAPVAPVEEDVPAPAPPVPAPAPVAPVAAAPVVEPIVEPVVAPAPVVPVVVPPPPVKVQLTPLQKQLQESQRYLQALVNPNDAANETIRDDPHFKEMQALLSEGAIKDEGTLRAKLEEARTRDKANPPLKKGALNPPNRNMGLELIGTLLDSNSRAKPNVQAKAVAKQAIAALVSKGMKEKDVLRMTLGQAEQAYQGLKLLPNITAPKNPLKGKAKPTTAKETPPPKQQAPAQSAAGAAEALEQNPQPLSQNEIDSADDNTTIESVVLSIVGDTKLKLNQISDLGVEIAKARAGNLKPLLDLVSELQAAEYITPDQAKALRTAGKPTKPIAAPKVSKAQIDKDSRVDEDTAEDPAIANEPIVHNPATKAILDEVAASDSKNKVADLLNRLAAQKGLRLEQTWLAKTLAAIIGKFNINLEVETETGKNNEGHAGWYNRDTNTVHIRQATPTTILHEVLHAVTANLMLYKQGVAVNPELRRMVREFDILLKHVQRYVKANPDAVTDPELKELLAEEQGPLGNARELLSYGMTHKEFQQLLARIPAPFGRRNVRNVWEGFKNAIAGLFKNITPKQRSALDAIIESTGELVNFASANPDMVTEAREAARLDPADSNVDFAQVSNAEAEDSNIASVDSTFLRPKGTFETLAFRVIDSTIGFEKAEQWLRQMGVEISDEDSITLAKVNFDGDVERNMTVDQGQVGDKVRVWMQLNAAAYGTDRASGVGNINKFYRNIHQLERYKVMWLENVRLKEGADLERQMLLDDVREATTDAEIRTAWKELNKLVNKFAEETEADYGSRFNSYYGRFQESLDELAELGINEESMTELNELMDGVRERTRERAIESGKVSEQDNWIKAYDYKWYVSLKGDPSIDKRVKKYEYEGDEGSRTLRMINSNLRSAEGRKTTAENLIEHTLADMYIRGRNAAENKLIQKIYNLVYENREIMGAKIRVFDGSIKDGYDLIGGKAKKSNKTKEKMTHYDTLPVVEGFTYHAGNLHYVVELAPMPRNGRVNPRATNNPLLRGIKGLYTHNDQWAATKLIGKVTNFQAKSNTVWHPVWTTLVAFVRDLTYTPLMIAMREQQNIIGGAPIMAKYYANLFANMRHVRSNAEVAREMIMRDNIAGLTELAEREGNEGTFAWWLNDYMVHGGGGNYRGSFNPTAITSELTSAYANEDGLYKIKAPLRVLDKWLTNYAALLDYTARVAAYKTLVESGGMSNEVAAAKTKGVLNFNQKGTHSQSANSYIMFFKVGMTSTDAIRKTFTTPTGKFDKAKFFGWAPAVAAIGFAGMAAGDMLGGDDEEGKSLLSKLKIDTLTQQFVVFIDGKPHGIPIGLGMPQLLLGPGIIEYFRQSGYITNDEAGRAMYELFARNAPVRPGGIPRNWGLPDVFMAWTFDSAVFSVFQPFAAISRNKNVFGNDIHDRFADDNLLKSDQAKVTTPQLWTDVASFLNKTAGVDMYPEDIGYLVRNYSGQIGAQILATTINADAREGLGLEGTSVGRTLTREIKDEEFYLSSRMYRVRDKLGTYVSEYGHINKQAMSDGMDKVEADSTAARWLAGNGPASRGVEAYKELDKAKKEYNKRIRELRYDKRSPEGKKLERKRIDSDLRNAVIVAEKAWDKDNEE